MMLRQLSSPVRRWLLSPVAGRCVPLQASTLAPSILPRRNFPNPCLSSRYASSKSEESSGTQDSSWDIPGSRSGGRKLAIVFTCSVCDTRSVKQFTEHAYKHGVVLAQCPGCKNRHLIADNLGIFEEAGEEGWNIERAMADLGEKVKTVATDDVMELTVEDMVGPSKLQSVLDDAQSKTEKT